MLTHYQTFLYSFQTFKPCVNHQSNKEETNNNLQSTQTHIQNSLQIQNLQNKKTKHMDHARLINNNHSTVRTKPLVFRFNSFSCTKTKRQQTVTKHITIINMYKLKKT